MAYLDFELNEPPEAVSKYQGLLRHHAAGIRKSAEYLLRALQLMVAVQSEDGRHYHGILFLLARHVAEEIDAASLLVAEGCVRPCKSHLRSALEAQLGVMYILEANHEQRALGYEVKSLRDRIRIYDKTDPNAHAGKQLRSAITKDPIANSVLAGVAAFDFDTARAALHAALNREPLKTVNDEWERMRKAKQRPTWHALFGGPKTTHDLAFRLNRAFQYEYLYSDWSDHIHAGSGAANVRKLSADPSGELKAFRPLRHPEGIKDVLTYGQVIAISVGDALAQAYLSPVGRDDLRDFYLREIRPVNEELKNIEIHANWF